MRTTSVRIAPLATLACALTWLLATAAPAAAGTYTVNACVAERFGFSTQAFVDFPALGIPTGGMYMRRACAPTDAAPFGLVAGNVVRSGRVKAGHQAGFVLDAPPGTSFLELQWSGKARRRDCRYAIQMYAVGPDGSLVKKIRNWRANRNCGKTDRGYTQVSQVGGIRRPVPFAMPGATRIVQRTVCVGGSRKRFCSARSINRIQTFWAEATIADNSPPTVAVVQDNPFTQGAWVNGNQSVTYTVSDNVGVKTGSRPGWWTRIPPRSANATTPAPFPCTNDPGAIEVRTTEHCRGNSAACGAGGGRRGQRGRVAACDRAGGPDRAGGSCGLRRGRRGMEVAEFLRRCVAEPGRGRPGTDRGSPLAPVPLGRRRLH